MISKKIVLVGDFAAGKTSLIRRFVDDQFSDTYLSTIGVKISKKMIELPHTSLQGIIWDIEGGTPNKPVNTTYFTGAHGAILVADITRDETVESIASYIALVKEKRADAPIVIALNKSDLADEARVQEVVAAANKRYGASAEALFVTSAKTGKGVEEMFHTLARKMTEG